MNAITHQQISLFLRGTFCVLLLAGMGYIPAYGQLSDAVPGSVTDSLRSGSDPSQMYAVYLPSEYSTDRKWPVLFIMDPRGRALTSLQRFQDPAEELGFVLLSSYNTRSDGNVEPNVTAINAMVRDMKTHYSIDQRRYYLAGFSGTARMAWKFAYQLPNQIAGIIGGGAGVPPGMLLPVRVVQDGIPFSFYGGAGHHDYNYPELLELENHLQLLKFPHKMVFYKGEHAWSGDSLWYGDALKWMHLQAMRKNYIPRDDTFIMKYYLESLQQLTGKKDVYEEFRGLQDLMNAFDGLVQHTEEIPLRYRNLEKSRSLARLDQQIDDLIDQYKNYGTRINEELNKLFLEKPPSATKLIKNLEIARLKKQAQNSSNPYAARWSSALLELMYVRASFYIPRNLLEQQKAASVAISLEIAWAVKPPDKEILLGHIRENCALNEIDLAMVYVRELLGLNYPAEQLKTDPELKPVTQHPSFSDLVQELLEVKRVESL